ncbi:MAG: putative toxin-antitoxin system toxin component, PIN family [Candidatus Kentron sp. G]|nr:MAG: putative toxin-antitoxin system toxin component, PIN family [Candidatus Kentron sp. G]VFN04342.1 MAG: putative toxin-antitoxin system toxin component, PIN family [Candidatus Kentron sp. G]VFN05487.1 MAG: putative toxin-antitoxin system toxin component, PIN family [Candidatus Kentron sp. G]
MTRRSEARSRWYISLLDYHNRSDIINDMSIHRVVLDTNIPVAASRSCLGASFALLRALRNGRYRALVSVPLMLEYEAVLHRPEQLAASGRNAAQTDAFLDALCLCIEPVQLHYLWRPQLRDPADEMVLETALNGHADALITLNVGDFAAAANFHLPVITPAAFVRLLQE